MPRPHDLSRCRGGSCSSTAVPAPWGRFRNEHGSIVTAVERGESKRNCRPNVCRCVCQRLWQDTWCLGATTTHFQDFKRGAQPLASGLCPLNITPDISAHASHGLLGMSTYMSTHTSTHVPAHMPTHASAHVSVHTSAHMSKHMSKYRSAPSFRRASVVQRPPRPRPSSRRT